jgi:hypothetical protein
MQSGTGKQISEAAEEFNAGPESDKPVVMVGGNAWGGLMTTCMKPHEVGRCRFTPAET